ncbi:unnamed protein product [Caenorhabditis brenneri]
MSTNKDTKLHVYTDCKFLDGDDPTKTIPELNAIAKCKNGPSVIANVALLDDQRQKSGRFESYFLIHRDEYEALKNSTSYSMDQKIELIKNLDFFVKLRPKRQFFIREVGGQIFLDEILNLLVYFVDPSFHTVFMEKYIEKFQLQDTHLVKTFSIQQVNEILGKLDIDKGRITVIPDIIHSLTSANLERNFSEPTLSIVAPNGAYVIHPSVAVLRVFNSLILYRDWSEEACKKDPDSMKKYKEETMKLLERCMLELTFYLEDPSFLVSVRHLNDEILKILVLRFSRLDVYLDRRTPNLFFDRNCNEVPIEEYERIVDVFGLPALRMNPSLPLFAARLCLIAAWMTIFEPAKKIKRVLLELFVNLFHSMEDESSAKSLIDRLCDDGQEQLPEIPEIIREYLGRIYENLDAVVRIPYSFRQLNNLPEKVKNMISPDGLRKLWRTRKFTKGLIIEEMEQAYMDAVFQSVSDYFHYKPDILSAFAKSLAVVVEQNQDLMKLVAENGSYSEIVELVCSLCSCPMVMFRVMLYKMSEHIKTIMKDCAPVPESSLMNGLGALNGLRDYWAPNDLPVNPKFQQLGDRLMNVVFESYINRFNGAPESQLDFEQQIFSTAHQDPRVKLMLKRKTNITIHKESKLPMEVHRFCSDYITKYEFVQPMVLEEIERAMRAKSEQATEYVGTSNLQIEDDKSTATDDTTEVLPRRSKSSKLRIENDRSSSTTTTTTITTDDTAEVLPRRSRSPKKKRTQPKHPQQRKPHSPPKFINGKVLKAIGKTRLNKKRHRTPDPPYRPNREAKKEPKPQEIQKVSSTCDKCYRMSQWCDFYKKYLVRTKVQLENSRIRANKYDELEKKMGEQTKMMEAKMEEKDRKIAELEKLLNARNDEQSAYIAQLEAQLAASQKKVLELEDPENQPTCSSFDANLQQNEKFKEMESRMKKMEEEFEKLKTRTSPSSAPDFEALQDQTLDKTASLKVSEKENAILVSRNLSLKEDVERLHREMEVMRERENAKDLELKKSQRENEVLQMTIQKHEESFKDVYYRFNNGGSKSSSGSQ